jgi:hypothetical protein
MLIPIVEKEHKGHSLGKDGVALIKSVSLEGSVQGYKPNEASIASTQNLVWNTDPGNGTAFFERHNTSCRPTKMRTAASTDRLRAEGDDLHGQRSAILQLRPVNHCKPTLQH